METTIKGFRGQALGFKVHFCAEFSLIGMWVSEIRASWVFFLLMVLVKC